MKTLGVCCGATTLQAVVLHDDPRFRSVEWSRRIPHEGNPGKAFPALLRQLDTFEIDRVAVTGRGFRTAVRLSSIAEPEAVEYALREARGERGYPDLVVSLGGETQMVYRISPSGGISSVHSGNKCASGTGEFFVQQARRMGLDVREAVELATAGRPYRIAGRCSVFCKSDCTHALNKGESRANVMAGLCAMMADKVCELIKDLPSERILLTGGGALNSAVTALLRRRFPHVETAPNESVFEAWGAALWALSHPCLSLPENIETVVSLREHSFGRYPRLRDARGLVDYKQPVPGTARAGDVCVLGLDVGSTTTKATVVRRSDRRILASVYLRTNGDPVEASRSCYRELDRRLNGVPPSIIGLGVTGSGRRIAGLHALTDNVINEIIAHATAARHFDPAVDTIFEIGGQDAKYTWFAGGVACDYAMNEACSAGTGSFLEESARESLNVATEDIGDLAMEGEHPPNFSDQCAAFISSDIKRASQEGITRNDILAGLVYSICLNYVNRVKGNRPVGERIFMQGGVCYNKAVPAAMASLLRKPITVPPDPGLMGAYGVALEVDRRLDRGLSEPGRFELRELAAREATREGSFVCAGGKEKCDRKCEIALIRIGSKRYPFGGICDRYYNLRFNRPVGTASLDLVALRRRLLFDEYSTTGAPSAGVTVGIPVSFLDHSLLPLFSTFFAELGMRIVLADDIDQDGTARIEAGFCLPAQQAHGRFLNLLKKAPDYIFLPHIMQIPVANVPTYSRACVFVQAQPYYMKTTFRRELEASPTRLLTPVLKMQKSYDQAFGEFSAMAVKVGRGPRAARSAFARAVQRQQAFERRLHEEGRRALQRLDSLPDTFGIVLFGRPYNAFVDEANMGVPHKLASRNHLVIPHDMLPVDHVNVDRRMFWAMGQKLMKAAQFVALRNNLFGVYITNFSCGPDSFIVSFFREHMRSKPSLTLELDQHTADAGIDTRIEAALDIIRAWKQSRHDRPAIDSHATFREARVGGEGYPTVTASDGTKYSLFDPRVELVLPSMGSYSARFAAATLRSTGINARALPVPDKDVLAAGHGHTTCKECLPYIVTTGSFLEHLRNHRDPSVRVTLLFMVTGGGPCRLGQYHRGLEQTIRRLKLRDVAVFTLSDENGYAGLGARTLVRAWQALVTADVLGDIRSMLRVTAEDREAAEAEVDSCVRSLTGFFEGRLSLRLPVLLGHIARRLGSIPLRHDPATVPVVSLVGEIFVRREEFSRNNVVEYLEERGFMVRVAPVAEYVCYSNYVIHEGLGEREFSPAGIIKMKVSAYAQEWWERRIKSILAESGLYRFEMIDVKKTIEGVEHLINRNLRGECILTVGLGLREILHDSCGIISIGPFGCMPSRVAESILKKEMTVEGLERRTVHANLPAPLRALETLPFLAVETDGSPFPQLVEANLEAFVLQARRVHGIMTGERGEEPAPVPAGATEVEEMARQA